MTNERAKAVARWMAGGVAVAAAVAGAAGTASADEVNTGSHNGPRVALVNVGQVDDPMEDVLEHVLLIGDGYRWG